MAYIADGSQCAAEVALYAFVGSHKFVTLLAIRRLTTTIAECTSYCQHVQPGPPEVTSLGVAAESCEALASLDVSGCVRFKGPALCALSRWV